MFRTESGRCRSDHVSSWLSKDVRMTPRPKPTPKLIKSDDEGLRATVPSTWR
jgi:hypothetical protein